MPAPGKGRAAALMVSLAIMGSRVLGVFREAVIGAMFGAGVQLDAFIAAFQIPNLLRDLFAEGALSTAFTTVFAKTEEREGPATAWELARLVLSMLILFMGLLCVLGVAFSPFLVNLTSFGFHAVEGKFEETVLLTRILFPFILFISVAAVVMGMLNSRFVFGIPAIAPMAFNLVSVGAGVALAAYLEPQSDWHHPLFTARGMIGIAIGVLLGGIAQLAVQLPALWRQGFRFRWQFNWRDPKLAALWTLLWPALIAASAVEINVLINGQFASGINGARSWLGLAFRVLYFPIGMFGVAIATVLLPSVARFASNHDRQSFGRHVEEALRLSLFLTVPAAAGLFALAPDILAPIYQRGAFTAEATFQTAAALRAYAFGLTGYAAIKVLVPCFHALGKPKIPLKVNLLAIGLNLGLNALLVLVLNMGHVGIAASMAAVSILNCVQLVALLKRDVPLGAALPWLKMGAIVLAGALLCGAGAWETVRLLKTVLTGNGLASQLIRVLVAAGVGGSLYAGFTALFGVAETRTALQIVRNKLARKG